MKHGLSIFSILSTILLINTTKLNFKNGEFTILQLTDLHYGESQWGDKRSSALTTNLIKQVNPDLIIVTGDSVSGYSWDGISTTFYQDSWQQWTSPMRVLEKPYAYTLGNHDAEGNLSREEVINLDKTHPFSLMPKDSISLSNYYLPIYSSDDKSVSAVIWLIDTLDEGCLGYPNSWACFDHVQWYEEESNKLKKELGYSPQGLAFFHIPFPEFKDVHNWRPTFGRRDEPIGCPKKNTNFFKSILKQQNIKGAFCGHDHNNESGGYFYGIELTYGRKTGYGGYGPDKFQRGGRVFKLKETDKDFTYSHYVVQEDGSIQQNGEATHKGWDRYLARCER
jgi:predicted MPP superfamily phosphohydrolase